MKEQIGIAEAEIKERYARVLEEIERAARGAGRKPEEIRLVVVTKTQPVERIWAVLEAGARALGENYAEEAIPKIQALSTRPGIEWHMIGHIQSRKARLVCEHFQYVHSLDSLRLAQRLNRSLEEMRVGSEVKKLPVLLECNVSGEESKFGFPAWREEGWDDLLPGLEEIVCLPNLEVRGLMTMAPYLPDAELARPYFRRLRQLRDFLARAIPRAHWDELSMGMSGDFPVAIQEGATWVRVGTAILGPRES